MLAPWKGNYDKPRQLIKISYHFASKGPYSQSYGPIVMYRCESSSWRRLSTEELMLSTLEFKKTLGSPLDSKEIKPVSPKGNPWNQSLEGLMLKLKLQYFGHLMWRAYSLQKTLMLGKIEGKRRRGWQRLRWSDSVTDSMGMGLCKLRETVKDRKAWRAAVHGATKSWTRLNSWKMTLR